MYISELKKKKEVKRMEVIVLPNWCYTEYAFYGDDAAVKRLGNDIRRFISKNYMENGFGKNWLGNIVLGYGFSYEGSSFTFRGSITELEENDGVLYIATETAWGPMTEMWDAIFDKHFQSDDGENHINYVFRAEEPGNGVYINTDTKGCFFPERYLLEIEGVPEHQNFESYYMSDEKEVIDTVNRIFGTELKTIKDVKAFLEEMQQECSGWISFHEYDSKY